MADAFRVGLTRDFLNPQGEFGLGDIGLDVLQAAPQIAWSVLPEHGRELTAADVDGCDALLLLGPRVTAATLNGTRRLNLIARFGVGYDNVDVEACTRNGVLLTITPDGVRRPVAAAAMAFLLALAHRMFEKDRLTRAGRWAEKTNYMGLGLTGRTLGIIGLGNTGRELAALAAPFGLRLVAADPYADAASARTAGVELLPLDDLLGLADFVCVCCALTDGTRHLLDERRLGLLRPTAFLINVARGPIIDQPALTRVLSERRIAGAGLDVFEEEPIDPADPLLQLDNVILAPHALCWTDELFRGNGRSACQSIVDVAEGRVPRYVVNPAVLQEPQLRARFQ
jgi:phosphoglycerate dehydrogenase-like enzyme